jgi:hypothetical protein
MMSFKESSRLDDKEGDRGGNKAVVTTVAFVVVVVAVFATRFVRRRDFSTAVAGKT